MRDSRFERSARTKEQRFAANAILGIHRVKLRETIKTADLLIKLTRIHPQRYKELDTDNLARSLKAIRDGVADAIAVDDNDKRLTWDYAQLQHPKEFGVWIEIFRRSRA